MALYILYKQRENNNKINSVVKEKDYASKRQQQRRRQQKKRINFSFSLFVWLLLCIDHIMQQQKEREKFAFE